MSPPEPPEKTPVLGPALENPLHGHKLEFLPMAFTLSTEDRLKAAMGLPAWMQRAKRLERHLERLEMGLGAAWRRARPEEWRRTAKAWDLALMNEEICAYNDYYPIERQLPMDPALRDFVDSGQRWAPHPLLDAAWILRRFPADAAGADLR